MSVQEDVIACVVPALQLDDGTALCDVIAIVTYEAGFLRGELPGAA